MLYCQLFSSILLIYESSFIIIIIIYFILSFLIILNSKLSLFLSSYLQDPSSNKYKQIIILQFSSVFLPVIFQLNYVSTLE